MSGLTVRLSRFWFPVAPPERLALLRMAVGGYALWYLGTRFDMLERVARTDPRLFDPVGLVAPLAAPLPPSWVTLLVVATLAANVAFLLGWRFRVSGPAFALLVTALLSYRNSWSMVYHSHNIVVLHALVIGLTPAAAALSLDARRRQRAGEAAPAPDWRFGWPVQLVCTVTVLTYFLAGVAKLAGPLGLAWGTGAALRSQIAVDALRKELLVSPSSPFAYWLYDHLWLLAPLAAGSLVLELIAPAALVSRRLGKLWAVNAFLMHWGILLLMTITFRYQLAGLAFASFFDVERLLPRHARIRDEAQPLLLFDGVCNLCNGWVRFVAARDPDARFRFASLQSDVGQAALARAGLSSDRVDSLVLIEGDRAWQRSDAVLRALRRLSAGWPVLAVLEDLPARRRDAVYDAVARRRYRWFGRSDSCPLPAPELRARFLD